MLDQFERHDLCDSLARGDAFDPAERIVCSQQAPPAGGGGTPTNIVSALTDFATNESLMTRRERTGKIISPPTDIRWRPVAFGW